MSKLYSKLFAKFYDSIMFSFEKKLEKDRRKMLTNLNGIVLDVGSGTGTNFAFFNNDVKIIAVEPSKPMLDKSIVKIKNKNIELINIGINNEKLNSIIEDNSLDAIVSTLVLCTIPNPELALKNFKRWLKPNGKLIVLEHIHSDNKYKAKFENFINPLWKKIGDGCNLNRNTDVLIKESGFKTNKESFFNMGFRIHKAVYFIE